MEQQEQAEAKNESDLEEEDEKIERHQFEVQGQNIVSRKGIEIRKPLSPDASSIQSFDSFEMSHQPPRNYSPSKFKPISPKIEVRVSSRN